jgi:ferredoxin
MAFVITRLCRDCVDGACVDVCPVECIVAHAPKGNASDLPNQLFIDPSECIDCNLCAPECPWEAIYPEGDVPPEFATDIELNARSQNRSQGYIVPVQNLVRKPSTEEVDANKQRWGLGSRVTWAAKL